MCELTQEQKEIIEKAYEVFCKVAEAIKSVVEQIREFWDNLSNSFITYVISLQPKKRYKFLKRIGIKNYVPFFRRNGIVRCRNNC